MRLRLMMATLLAGSLGLWSLGCEADTAHRGEPGSPPAAQEPGSPADVQREATQQEPGSPPAPAQREPGS
jgi:hypothetical protein